MLKRRIVNVTLFYNNFFLAYACLNKITTAESTSQVYGDKNTACRSKFSSGCRRNLNNRHTAACLVEASRERYASNGLGHAEAADPEAIQERETTVLPRSTMNSHETMFHSFKALLQRKEYEE